MIKIALKHFIYEQCIDLIFDGINKNFVFESTYNVNLGDYYHYIKTHCKRKGDFNVFYECDVVSIHRNYFCINHQSMGLYTEVTRFSTPVHKKGFFSRIYYEEIKELPAVIAIKELPEDRLEMI